MTTTAAYYTGNQSFAIEQVESVAPVAAEVQIEVAYCGICGTDLHVYLGHMDQRIGHHRVIGHEMSGIVREVGPEVASHKVGDRVVVRPLDACGQCPACTHGNSHICQKLKFLGLDTDGAFQQRWNVPAHTLHVLPDSLSLEHAALIEPVAVACHDVRLGRVAPGDDVLVIGGGPIGMLIAMVAQQAGALVTVSEVNEHRLMMANALGFKAINPAKQDVASTLNEATAGKGVEVVFEVSGTQSGVALMTQIASVRGRIVMVAIHAQKPEIDLFQFFWREIEMIGARVYEPEDYDAAIRLVATEAIPAKALITNVQALEAIGEAFAELSNNLKAMKTLIRCGDLQ